MKKFSEELSELADADGFFSAIEASLPRQIAELARWYTRRCLRSRVTRQSLEGLSPAAARKLCRANLEQAYLEFAAWTPMAAAAPAGTH